MYQRSKIMSALAVLLAISGTAGAAHHESDVGGHATTPPADSNRQSTPDADRGLDRATERRSDPADDHSNAPSNSNDENTRTPDRGLEHRNPDRSMDSEGKGWKSPSD